MDFADRIRTSGLTLRKLTITTGCPGMGLRIADVDIPPPPMTPAEVSAELNRLLLAKQMGEARGLHP